jgi:hypothetical protein
MGAAVARAIVVSLFETDRVQIAPEPDVRTLLAAHKASGASTAQIY